MRAIRFTFVFILSLLACMVAFAFWAGTGPLDTTVWVDTYSDEGPVVLEDTLTIMTYNVGYLSGMTNNRPVDRKKELFGKNLARVVEALEDARPHVVALQEVDLASRRSFYVDQVDALARGGGYAAAGVAVNWDERYVPFPSAWPPHHFGRVVSSQALLSRYSIRDHDRVVLPSPPGAPLYESALLARIAKMFYIDRLAQVAVLDADPPVAIVNVHFEAWDASTREDQARTVIELVDSLQALYPVFVVGDFNTVTPAAKRGGHLAASDLERFRNDRSLELLLAATGLSWAVPDSRNERSTFTYSSADPHVGIDHILYDPARYRLVGAQVLDVQGHPSDHRPVVARFVPVHGMDRGGGR